MTLTFEEFKKADVLAKLEFWRDLPHGTLLGNLGFPDPGWDEPIRQMCQEAIEEIMSLRAKDGQTER